MSSSFKINVTYSLHMCRNMLSKVNLSKIDKVYVVSRKLTDNDILELEKSLESMDWFLLTEDRIAVSADDVLVKMAELGRYAFYEKKLGFIYKLKFELLLFMPYSTVKKPIVLYMGANNTVDSCCTDRIYYKNSTTGNKEQLPHIVIQFPNSVGYVGYNSSSSIFIIEGIREAKDYVLPLMRFLAHYCPKFLKTVTYLPPQIVSMADSINADNSDIIIYVRGRLKKIT